MVDEVVVVVVVVVVVGRHSWDIQFADTLAVEVGTSPGILPYCKVLCRSLAATLKVNNNEKNGLSQF